MMKPRLSVTQLMMFERCGEQYRQRYVLGRRIPPGFAQIRGTAVHVARETALKERIAGGSWTAEAACDIASETVRQAFRGEVRLDETFDRPSEAARLCEEQSIALARLDASTVLPGVEPKHVEYRIEIEPKGWPFRLLGIIDLRDVQDTIIDAKTASKSPAAGAADKSLQLSTYSLISRLSGQPEAALRLDYLIYTPKGHCKYKALSTRRTQEDIQILLNRFTAMVLALEKGVFLPCPPDSWQCSPRWCGYYADCAYATRLRRPEK